MLCVVTEDAMGGSSLIEVLPPSCVSPGREMRVFVVDGDENEIAFPAGSLFVTLKSESRRTKCISSR